MGKVSDYIHKHLNSKLVFLGVWMTRPAKAIVRELNNYS